MKIENHNIEDEIDLRELFFIIWKHKIFISGFVFIITSLSIIWALSKPNEYKVYTLLAPQEQSKSSSLGSLGALASIAGVNIGNSGGGMTPDIAFSNLLDDYIFMKTFIIKNNIDKILSDKKFDKKFVFAMNNRYFYDLFHHQNLGTDATDIFNLYNTIRGLISITHDKKTSLINVSVQGPNREFNLYLLNKFLEDATKYLVKRNLNDINSKIQKYQKELQTTANLELKSELAKLISNLIKQKVYINISKYYKVKVITEPYIPDIKAKIKPKRSLIVIVAFITSLILGIFIVLFIEFIKDQRREDEPRKTDVL